MKSRLVRMAVVIIGIGAFAAGCGKYSISNIRSLKAFQDANTLYRKNEFKAAIERGGALLAGGEPPVDNMPPTSTNSGAVVPLASNPQPLNTGGTSTGTGGGKGTGGTRSGTGGTRGSGMGGTSGSGAGGSAARGGSTSP